MANADAPTSFNQDFPTASALKQLASQLDQWRGMLPPDLQWPEDDPTAFPISLLHNDHHCNQKLRPNLSPHRPQYEGHIFTTDPHGPPAYYLYKSDIQVALLRAIYYLAKYTLHRPFIYKALHFPEQMTQEDAETVAECLCVCILLSFTWCFPLLHVLKKKNAKGTWSCLKCPLALAPIFRQKRLIPFLFCWSQNFLGILLIIHLTNHSPMLQGITAQLCGERFETEVGQSVDLMLDWIRDLKNNNLGALWYWKVLQGIYHIEE